MHNKHSESSQVCKKCRKNVFDLLLNLLSEHAVLDSRWQIGILSLSTRWCLRLLLLLEMYDTKFLHRYNRVISVDTDNNTDNLGVLPFILFLNE